MRFLGFLGYMAFAVACFIAVLVLQGHPTIFLEQHAGGVSGYHINYVSAIATAGLAAMGCVALIAGAWLLRRD